MVTRRSESQRACLSTGLPFPLVLIAISLFLLCCAVLLLFFNYLGDQVNRFFFFDFVETGFRATVASKN